MSSRDPTDWMWAQACEVLQQAERLHRQYFRLTVAERAQPVWEPPVDVYEDDQEFVVVIALPGVPAERIEVTTESGALVVRAESRLPFAGSRWAVQRLEIPYGYFERRVSLPAARLEAGAHELTNGCLILRLRKAG